MQCTRCGRPLQPRDAVCPLCGQRVDALADEQPTTEFAAVVRPGALQIGEPEDPFANTVVATGGSTGQLQPAEHAPDPAVPPASGATPNLDSGVAPVAMGLRLPAVAPAAPAPAVAPRRTVRWLPLLALCCAGCVVVVLVAGALASSGQWLTTLAGANAHPTATARLGSTAATATAAARICPLPAVDAHAAPALQSVQLTTGIQNPQTDLPLDRVTTFHVGQTVYVAFALGTNAAGSLATSICTNGLRAAKTLAVPAGELHRHGEFNLPAPLTSAQVGPGAIVLTWNGVVAAALRFSVTLH